MATTQIAVTPVVKMAEGDGYVSSYLYALDAEGQLWRAMDPDRVHTASLTWEPLPVPGREFFRATATEG